jgi:hypothetical protein
MFFFLAFIFLNYIGMWYTQGQCIPSYDNSTAMYVKIPKNLTPWRDSNFFLSVDGRDDHYATPPGPFEYL